MFQFSLKQQKMISNFKPITQPIYSLVLHGSLLALGSRAITLWDLSKKRVVRSLTGHASPVSKLESLDSFLYSSSQSERVVSVWNWQGEVKDSVMSLRANQEVMDFALKKCDNEVLVSVVTRQGNALVMTCNPKEASTASIKHLSVNTERGTVRLVTAAMLTADLLHIAHGAGMDLILEQVKLSSLEEKTTLVRGDKGTESVKKSSEDCITPKVDGNVVFLAPGSSLGKSGDKKKDGKRKIDESESLPMEVTNPYCLC